MKRLYSAILLLGVIHAGYAAQLVTNGTNATQGEYPFFVSIGPVKKPINSRFSDCGGALIAPHWVLTAKHCMENYYPGIGYGAKVAAGSANLSVPGSYQEAQVTDTIYYNDNDSIYGDDIALVKLDHDLTLPTIQMGNYQISAGDTVTVIGFGVDNTGRPSVQLQQANIPVDDNSYCAVQTDLSFVPGFEFCAGTTSGLRINAGIGDSGGPVFQVINGQPVLVGIVSRGQYNWTDPIASIYTSVQAFYQWVNTTIANN